MAKRERRVLFATEATEWNGETGANGAAVPVASDGGGSSESELEEEPEAPLKRARKQLSAQDIQVARETAEVFKLNIFKMQTDELLNEIKLKDSHVDRVEKVLHRLHELIQMVPTSGELLLEEIENFSDKVAIPFPDPKPTGSHHTFEFATPQLVDLVGLFGLKTGSLTNLTVDMVVTMPELTFGPKDYLNYRALYKRAFCTAWLAHHLAPLARKHRLPVKIAYSYFNGDVLTPCLRIELVKTDSLDDLHFHKTKLAIQVIIGMAPHVFEGKKLLPDKNCVRIKEDMLPPTPLYNALVLSNTLYGHYLRYLYTSKKLCELFKDAAMLARVWLQKRGFSGDIGSGGFGHFEFCTVMAALLHGGGTEGNKVLLHGFSLYQLFKLTVKYLAETDLQESGYLSFTSEIGSTTALKWKQEGFRVPTVFDKFTKLNVLWKMTPDLYQLLRSYARELLHLLNDVIRDRFDALLLQKTGNKPLLLSHDYVVTIDISSVQQDINFSAADKILYLTFENYVCHRLSVVVRRALGERATNVVVQHQRTGIWGLTKRKPAGYLPMYTIQIRVNPEEAAKQVTRGPANSDSEDSQAKFRGFWGKRALMRRFKDGLIQNCVVWEPLLEPLVFSIIKYVLDSHVAKGISEMAELGGWDLMSHLPASTAKNTWVGVTQTFEKVARTLVNLELPLRIKSLLPALATLRQTAVLEPVPFAVLLPDFWNDCILQFEHTVRWPDELAALEQTKTALLLKIAAELGKLRDDYHCLVVEDQILIPFVVQHTLNLVVGGYGFRVRVTTDRDETMYLRAVANGGSSLKHTLQEVYLKWSRSHHGILKHTRTVQHLVHHFPAYLATVRLFKVWLDSHLLLSHFGDELIELVVLKVFVDPAPYPVPHLAPTGFLQVLAFLAQWNWREDPLILDLAKEGDDEHELSDRLTVAAYKMIEDNFRKIRSSDPSAIRTQWFVGSKDDPLGILWSHDILLPIALRLTALARAAVATVSPHFAALGLGSAAELFVPALNDYDFVLTLSESLRVLAAMLGLLPPGAFKNLNSVPQRVPDNISAHYDLHWAFYTELEARFGQVVLFLTHKYNALSSPVVTGIFVPAYQGKRKFRPSLGFDTKPAGGEDVELNREGVLAQVKGLGGEMVEKISM